MKKAIIVGASSGIGFQLAKLLSAENYSLGLAARRLNLLEELKGALPGASVCSYMDISNLADVEHQLHELIRLLGGLDLIVISSGTGHLNPELDWQKEQETIAVNVLGFAKVLNAAVKYFESQGSGHIVGISSIGALRGSREAPAYNASKAFISNYMEGIRCRFKKSKKDIFITDIRPGLVDTAMAKGDGLFWLIPADVAAKRIYSAILKKKDKVYFTKRWAFIAFILRHLPDRLYYKM